MRPPASSTARITTAERASRRPRGDPALAHAAGGRGRPGTRRPARARRPLTRTSRWATSRREDLVEAAHLRPAVPARSRATRSQRVSASRQDVGREEDGLPCRLEVEDDVRARAGGRWGRGPTSARRGSRARDRSSGPGRGRPAAPSPWRSAAGGRRADRSRPTRARSSPRALGAAAAARPKSRPT